MPRPVPVFEGKLVTLRPPNPAEDAPGYFEMNLDKPSGQLVGRFFLCMENREGIIVIGEGNRISKPFWRKGHNREARMLLFPYAFETLQADIYETGAWSENENSIRSIEAHGFTFE